MPALLTYPGVYIEELPSGVRTITGVATSITAFIGRALQGPTDEPITINNYGDFERIFGGLWVKSRLGYAVRDFFLNGGNQAIIVRLFRADTDNTTNEYIPLTVAGLTLEALYPGSWGVNLRAGLDLDISADAATALGLTKDKLFNLTLRDARPNGRSERFNNLTLEDHTRRIDRVLAAESKLARWKVSAGAVSATLPKAISDAQAAATTLATEKAKLAALASSDPGYAAQKTAVATAQANLNTALLALLDEVSQKEQALSEAKRTNPPGSTAVQNAQTALKTALDKLKPSDGVDLTKDDFTGVGKENAKQGLYALRKADLFNLLCIPPYLTDGNVDQALVAEAAAYCERRRAMLLVDPPTTWTDKDAAKSGLVAIGTNSKNAALFFPRLRQPNPLRDNQPEDFVPSGAVAGIFSRTDTNRGVWKAPAGLEANLVGVPELSVQLTDAENGELNPLGINCLRALSVGGRVVWGSRTLQGDDRLASEWKYIPVRRTTLFIEESLFRGTQWAVFEPNDEPLWAQLRLNIGAFMNNLFRQGAFQGRSAGEAYFVKCDHETTTQNDINQGVVNVVVGFAPLKPAEFVVIKFQQIAGQIQT